jgi:hypothetical protein
MLNNIVEVRNQCLGATTTRTAKRANQCLGATKRMDRISEKRRLFIPPAGAFRGSCSF